VVKTDDDISSSNPPTNGNLASDQTLQVPTQNSVRNPTITTIQEDSIFIPQQNTSNPIPKNTRDRRHRALSLSAQERPASVVEALSKKSTEELNTNSSAPSSPTSFTPSSNSSSSSSLPLPQNSPTQGTHPGKKPPMQKRVSFKEKIRKTFGLKESSSNEFVEPRTLRFHFSVSTTSSKDPKVIVSIIENVLTTNQVAFERDKYLFLCRKNDIAFELEICKLPRLSLNGLRYDFFFFLFLLNLFVSFIIFF